jgi:hypothetical protein
MIVPVCCASSGCADATRNRNGRLRTTRVDTDAMGTSWIERLPSDLVEPEASAGLGVGVEAR